MRLVVALLLSILFAGPALAGPFEDGVAAFERRDYATAIRLWRPLAEQGNAKAQSGLAGLYGRGQGVVQTGQEMSFLEPIDTRKLKPGLDRAEVTLFDGQGGVARRWREFEVVEVPKRR